MRLRTETARVLRDTYDAEDAAQEALLRVWRYRDSQRNPAQRAAWLSTVARNAALAHADRRGRQPVLEPLEARDHELARDDPHLLATLDRAAFESLLSPFKSDERNLLALRYIDDLAYAELAEQLNLPVGTIKVRLHRLRRRLKTLIEEREKQA